MTPEQRSSISEVVNVYRHHKRLIRSIFKEDNIDEYLKEIVIIDEFEEDWFHKEFLAKKTEDDDDNAEDNEL